MSGFSQALALGKQPREFQEREEEDKEGAEWLRKLQSVSGLHVDRYAAQPPSGTTASHLAASSSQDECESGEEGGGAGAAGGNLNTSSVQRNASSKRRARGRGRGALAIGTSRTGSGGGTGGGGADDKGANDEESAANLRKAQNRTAQREFRLRKQQYIRALEARVELLSSDHDTQVDRLRYTLRGLLTENNQLRQLLASFASFVGLQQIGGPLQKAGMSRQELEGLIFTTSEQVLTDNWQNWPRAQDSEALRQIRLENNLPPEGLPESNRRSAQTRPSGLPSAERATSTNTSTTSSEPNQLKRKASRSDDLSRPSPTEAGSAVTSSSNNASAEPSSSQQRQQVPSRQSLLPSASHDPGMSKALADFFSSSTNPFNLNYGPSSSSSAQGTNLVPQVFPGSSALSSMSPPLQLESSALMASLFGNSILPQNVEAVPQSVAGGSFKNPTSSPSTAVGGDLSSGSVNQINPGQIFAASAPSAQASFENSGSGNVVEEPEEAQRVKVIIGRLMRQPECNNDVEILENLNRVGDAMLVLVRQMASFRRRPSFLLPSILQPSEIQQRRPHDPLIDSLPYPAIRRSLIAHQASFIIDDVIMSILSNSRLHAGDPLDERNWELMHGFMRTYPQLIDRQTVENANRWRTQRDESKLSFDELVGTTPAAY